MKEIQLWYKKYCTLIHQSLFSLPNRKKKKKTGFLFIFSSFGNKIEKGLEKMGLNRNPNAYKCKRSNWNQNFQEHFIFKVSSVRSFIYFVRILTLDTVVIFVISYKDSSRYLLHASFHTFFLHVLQKHTICEPSPLCCVKDKSIFLMFFVRRTWAHIRSPEAQIS